MDQVKARSQSRLQAKWPQANENVKTGQGRQMQSGNHIRPRATQILKTRRSGSDRILWSHGEMLPRSRRDQTKRNRHNGSARNQNRVRDMGLLHREIIGLMGTRIVEIMILGIRSRGVIAAEAATNRHTLRRRTPHRRTSRLVSSCKGRRGPWMTTRRQVRISTIDQWCMADSIRRITAEME